MNFLNIIVMKPVKRHLSARVSESLDKYPVVLITGAKGVGKTTLAKSFGMSYYDLGNYSVLSDSFRDPKGFIEALPEGSVIDDLHRAPHLFAYIKKRLQKNNRAGQFLLLGSSRSVLEECGRYIERNRYANLAMAPLTIMEIMSSCRGNPLDTLFSAMNADHALRSLSNSYSEPLSEGDVMTGGFPYPSLCLDSNESKNEWFNRYKNDYLDHITRTLQLKEIKSFLLFTDLVAGFSSEVTNYSDLSRWSGVSVDTAKRWTELMVDAYITPKCHPFLPQVSKRMVVSPKIYMTDSGLCFNMIHNGSRHGMDPITADKIFKTWVFQQLSVLAEASKRQINLYFFRTFSGEDVDFILEHEQKIIAIKTISSPAVSRRDTKGLAFLRDKLGSRFKAGLILHNSKEIGSEDKQFAAVPVTKLFRTNGRKNPAPYPDLLKSKGRQYSFSPVSLAISAGVYLFIFTAISLFLTVSSPDSKLTSGGVVSDMPTYVVIRRERDDSAREGSSRINDVTVNIDGSDEFLNSKNVKLAEFERLDRELQVIYELPRLFASRFRDALSVIKSMYERVSVQNKRKGGIKKFKEHRHVF